MKDCYKDLVDTLLNFGDPLFNENARLIDKCTDSVDSDITIIEYIPVATTSDFYFYGDDSRDTATSCWPGDQSTVIPWAWNLAAYIL